MRISARDMPRSHEGILRISRRKDRIQCATVSFSHTAVGFGYSLRTFLLHGSRGGKVMIARQTVLAAVLICAAFTASPLSAQLAPNSSYAHVLDLYRAGQDQAARRALAEIPSAEIEWSQRILLKAFDSTVGDESSRAAASMRVAALIHTERAIAAHDRDNFPEWRYQLGVARKYVEKLASRDPSTPFPRTWCLMTLAYLQGRYSLRAAKEFGDWAHDAVGDSPELFLAMGATQEMGWTAQHEEGVDSQFKGDLKDAERAYRNALSAQPDLVEARLRLGRVLTLHGDTEGAVRILAEIGEGSEGAYRYLARMFEGDLCERRGDAAEAERRYLAATALLPRAQSAYMALAHVRHSTGARAAAAADVRATTLDTSVPDAGDPWFWYSHGLSWRANGYLADLREMIRQ
jgi:tetratricopeptide (TPR) repeat protein